MRRLLVVPYFYSEDFRCRPLEYALRLRSRYDVYVWRSRWLAATPGRGVGRRLCQLRSALLDVARPVSVVRRDGLSLVDAPFLQPALLRPVVGLERALGVARRFNRKQLDRLIRRFSIQRVLMSSTWLDLPRVSGVAVYHDVFDYFDENKLAPAFRAREKRWYGALLRGTSANFAVSAPVVRKLELDYRVAGAFAPNGVDVTGIRGASTAQVMALRRRLELEGRWILGYFGNHGPHAGLDFLLEVFARLARRSPEAALVVGGPYGWWEGRIRMPSVGNVRFLGPVPLAEMPTYAALQDVTVHPCEKSAFRNHALPLKVIEASAARKFVVSTDIESLRALGLPNVVLVTRDVEAWVEALFALRGRPWRPEWDVVIEQYDWQRIADAMADRMEEAAAVTDRIVRT